MSLHTCGLCYYTVHIGRPQDIRLSECGTMVQRAIKEIPKRYPAISVDAFTVMPNHIHLLLQITTDADGRPMVAPTISTVVKQLKGVVSKQVGAPIWQKGFYDHVVRGEKDHLEIMEYVQNNPIRWMEDSLCV